MMLFFANAASTAPEGLKDWLEALVWLAGAVLLALKIFSHFRTPSPIPPLHDQFADRAETDKRFDALERKIESVRIETRGQFDAMIHAGEERAMMLRAEITRSSSQLHKRVDDILQAVSRVEGKLDKN